MSTAEILGSLLQVEENFSSCLARIHALILKPLLQAEPHDPKEKENFQLLVLLNDRFQALWNFTEENSRILREKRGSCDSGGIQDFYILWKGDLFLSLYIQGTLKWHDGRNHVGDFQEGLEHGFGICLVPRRSEDRYDCYKCHWYQGKMQGYGICEYGSDQVYKGYFKDNVRQGFGILENFSAEHPFKYTGQWENDKKNGYGVWEDKERGERYIGMWLDDLRHGEGIVVTQSGLCYQRTFHADKMVGLGILLLEDDSVYEGNFTEDLAFVGKGKLSLANGFVLEGTFSARGGRGLHTRGVLNTSNEPREPQPPIGTEEISEDILEELVQHQELPSLQSYLEKALRSSLHPLGKLLRALSTAFQATYSGIGANRHLLAMAQEEVKFYAKKIWEFYQGLLGLALERSGQKPSEEADPRSVPLRDLPGGSQIWEC
ncbi:ALS2 C-terminal like protein [Turdus rufiventris]|nr:ALS2 C-terminal like protein [Turdus rufiventris]